MNRAVRSISTMLVVAAAICAVSTTFTVADDNPTFPREPKFLEGRSDAVWAKVRGAAIIAAPGGKRIGSAALGDGFEVISRGKGFVEVKLKSGGKGFISVSQVSPAWILIEKRKKKLSYIEARKVVEYWGADFGFDPEGDKRKEGDGKTPEGEYYVAGKIPRSQFYKAFLISYPQIEHADAGLKDGLITKAQYNVIAKAIKSKSSPPQTTPLGGYVEIHGNGTGGAYNWTLGCIGMPNDAMDFMWDKIAVGAPIVIVP